MSLAKPFARASTQCPYCDHVSPAGSKFCGECGAALHLMPCPHCGAVNDITVATACYRCHRELREAPAPAPAETVVVEAEPARPRQELLPYVVEPPRQRPHALVVGVVLIAFAAASFYAFRQKTELQGRMPETAEVKVRAAEPASNAGTGTIVKAPVDNPPPSASAPAAAAASIAAAAGNPLAPGVEIRPAKAEAPAIGETPAPLQPASAAAPRQVAGRAAARAREPLGVEPAAVPSASRVPFEPGKGIEKSPPNIGPCTDAVAALGLCTPASPPRSP